MNKEENILNIWFFQSVELLMILMLKHKHQIWL